MALKYVQTLTLYQAGAGNIIGATSVVLTSFTDIYGNAITSMTPFGATGYITLEPDTTNEEGAIFTGITVNANGTTTLTGISTILAQSPYTATSGLIRNHAGGSKVVVTDNVAFWNTFGNKNNDEALVGRWTTPVTPTNPNDLVNKAYADGLVIAGALAASTSAAGYVQEATQAQVDARTITGSTGAKLFAPLDKIRSSLLSDYVASDTGSANAYAIVPTPTITAYAAGQRFTFKAANANTGASTLNVSTVGVKTIKKNGTLDLSPNDILVGQIVEVLYDGTNMLLMTPTAANVVPVGIISPYIALTPPTGWLVCDGSAVSRSTYASLFSVMIPLVGNPTITLASPGVFSLTSHGLQEGDIVFLTTTGALPTGLSVNTAYYVIATGLTTNAFEVSATRGGSAINTSVSQSGTHSLFRTSYGLGDGATTFNVPDLRGNVAVGRKSTDNQFAMGETGGEKTHVLSVTELPSHTHNVTINQGGSGGTGGSSASSSASSLTTDNGTGGNGAHNNLQPYNTVQYIIKV